MHLPPIQGSLKILMVTRFPLMASPIVELNIQLMKILVLKLFLPSTKTSLTAIS